MSDETLLEFPCEFPLKIVGLDNDTLRDSVSAALAAANAEVLETSERPSRAGKYVSLTVKLVATSREQLDGIYAGLTALEDVKWVL